MCVHISCPRSIDLEMKTLRGHGWWYMSRKMEAVQRGRRSGEGWADKPTESSTVAEELFGKPFPKLSITSGSRAVPIGQAPGPEHNSRTTDCLLACSYIHISCINVQHHHFPLAQGPLLHYVLDTAEVKGGHNPFLLTGLRPHWAVAARMVS